MRLTSLARSFAYAPGDSPDTRFQKVAILIVAGACCVAGLVWSLMYLLVFGWVTATFLPFAFVVVVGSALLISHLTRQHLVAVYAQVACIIVVTAGIQWVIGGIFDSGFVLTWALLGPLIALMFFPIRHALAWLALYLICLAITAAGDSYLTAHRLPVPDGAQTLFFLLNLSMPAIVIFAFASYFVTNALREKQRADRLLLNILPEKIANTLKYQQGTIAEEHKNISVLFADIVEYTKYSSDKKPVDIVKNLNKIFYEFDTLVQRHRLEKIKTIGDAYMVVGGLPPHDGRHHQAIAAMALDMLAAIQQIRKEDGHPFELRIGIHNGDVVAGVIGHSKFAYDLWGDTVNLASRLEASATPGRIHVSASMQQILANRFLFEKRAPITLKGKGEVATFFLLGIRPDRDGMTEPRPPGR